MPRKKKAVEVRDAVRERILRDQKGDLDLTLAVADSLGAYGGEEPQDLDEGWPAGRPSLTVNQLVAYNMQRARKSRGWDQDYLGARLAGATGRAWSRASVSAAEASWRGGRTRRFDANEIVALARIFDLPLDWFFLPPDSGDTDITLDVPGEVGVSVLRPAQLMEIVAPERPPAAEFVDRVRRFWRSDWLPGFSRSSTITQEGAEAYERFVRNSARPTNPTDPPEEPSDPDD